MTQDMVKGLTDAELGQVIAWSEGEIKLRAEKRKQEAITKIKALAGSVGVTVTIAGQRGRPATKAAAFKPATQPVKDTYSTKRRGEE